jgi:hypothetical protein
MATLQEIKKALRMNPDLINKVQGLREFVEKNIEEFDFLYTGSNGFAGKQPTKEVNSPVDKKEVVSKKWNPVIKPI